MYIKHLPKGRGDALCHHGFRIRTANGVDGAQDTGNDRGVIRVRAPVEVFGIGSGVSLVPWASRRMSNRSASEYGSGPRIAAWTILKTGVFAPMPNADVRRAVDVNPGDFAATGARRAGVYPPRQTRHEDGGTTDGCVDDGADHARGGDAACLELREDRCLEWHRASPL